MDTVTETKQPGVEPAPNDHSENDGHDAKPGVVVEHPSDSTAVRRVIRKLDLRLAPLFAVLYFVAYLDRSNIGNASVAGLNRELGLSDAQFSTAVSVFYATYVAFEIPAVLAIVRWIGPKVGIAAMSLGWSLVTIGTAFVTEYRQLVALRLLMGFFEAGFFPCLSLYITMVYKREEQVCFCCSYRCPSLHAPWSCVTSQQL